MNVRQPPPFSKRMPLLSPRNLPTSRDSLGIRLGNVMLSNYMSRNATQRGLLHTPSRNGASSSCMASCNSSPEDVPLTVNHTRPARRRRIIESDDEGEPTPSRADPQTLSPLTGSSPRRQLALRSPKAPNPEQRALQNLTNLPGTPSAGCATSTTARLGAAHAAGAAIHEGPGKRGILELSALLRTGSGSSDAGVVVVSDSGVPAVASSCTTGLAAHPVPTSVSAPATSARVQPQALWPGPSSATESGPAVVDAGRPRMAAAVAVATTADAGDSDGSDDAEVSLVFTRSIRAPRTLRQRVDSEDGGGDAGSSEDADLPGGAGPDHQDGLGAAAGQVHSGGAVSSPAPPCLFGTPDVQRVAHPASSQTCQSRSSSFHSACSDEEESSCRDGGGVAGGSGGLSCPEATQASQQPQPQQGPSAASPPLGRAADPTCIIAPDVSSLMGDLAGAGLGQLAKVPRRRQGRRAGRDAAGEAAAAALSDAGPIADAAPGPSLGAVHGRDGGDAARAAGASHTEGLMYDLYGELQLLSQLGGLSLAAAGAPEGDSDDSDSGRDEAHGNVPPAGPSSAASPPVLSPPLLQLHQPPPTIRTAAVEVLDLTLMTSSSSSSSSRDGAASSSARTSTASGGGDPADHPGPGGRSSPGGLLDVYRQAQTGVLRAAGPPPDACGMPSAGKRDVDAAAGSCGGVGGDYLDDSDSELELQLGPRCKRPPTTARRRAVVLDSSTEGGSPQPPPPPQQQQQQQEARGLHERAGGLRLGGRAGAGTFRNDNDSDSSDGAAVVGAAEALAALTLTGAGRQQSPSKTSAPGGWRGGPRTPGPPTCDPYDLADDDGDDEDGDDVRDCALETPLPSFLSQLGSRGPHGGGLSVRGFGGNSATPSLLQLPLSLRTPGPGLGDATPTTAAGRKDQRRRDGVAPNGTQEAPSHQQQPQQLLTPAGGEAGTGGTKSRPKARAPRTRAAAEHRAFLAGRARVAQELYDKWNRDVFEGRLPSDLPLVWNSRLTSTAGQVVAQRELPGSTRRVPAKLELSPRLIDSPDKLRNTLSHEMCHVAAWHISHEYDRPHGPAWESWARCFMRYDPSLVIRRTHDYITQYAHRWRCTRQGCGKEYGRQRQTIRVGVHVCAVCHSQLEYLGHFDKNGNLKQQRGATPAAVGAAGGALGNDGRAEGTAAKPLNEFAQFCKENFKSVRTTMPARTPASAVFKHMGLLFQKQKAILAATAAAGAQGGAGSGGRRRGGAGSGSPSSGLRGSVERQARERELQLGGEELLPRLMDLSLAEAM
ncbi:hypothetical protein PLESTB_001835700 [Pleodorina starrii]|uniref:SprT-like domain-containing protein n=1 Tax=Pleodorina starrii TaxID=330485 RepID=A0A9W6FA71_9CHLO|nr:hypothetical protein PLESTM_002051800 [Pleodorina starrii]GLC62054.1 hypothetical protein PLESTB_001835700 [Pleodorina starrii]GLC65642.1 hypothetical protein PLESTF_000322000 [Pleodorina starrii]